LMPMHVSLTGKNDQKIGWNVYAPPSRCRASAECIWEMTVDPAQPAGSGLCRNTVERPASRADQCSARRCAAVVSFIF